jgi:hypothetical protein
MQDITKCFGIRHYENARFPSSSLIAAERNDTRYDTLIIVVCRSAR